MFSTTTAAAAGFACLAVLSTQVRAHPETFGNQADLTKIKPGDMFGMMSIDNYEMGNSIACEITSNIPAVGFTAGESYTFKISTNQTAGLGMVWHVGGSKGDSGNPGRLTEKEVAWTAHSADDSVSAWAICGAGGSYQKMHVAASVTVKKVVPASGPDDTTDPANGPNGKGCANGVVTDVVEADGAFTCSCVGTLFKGANCDTSNDDTAFPANGPNGKGCANGVVTDVVEGDGAFTCDCVNTRFLGANCDIDKDKTKTRKNSSSSDQDDGMTAVVVVLVLLGVVVVVAGVVIWMALSKYKQKNAAQKSQFSNPMYSSDPGGGTTARNQGAFGLANTNTNTNADAYMDVSGTKTVEGVVTRGDGDEV